VLLAAVLPKANGYDSCRAEIAEEVAAIRAELDAQRKNS
jgi:hypothetical protein